MNQVIAQTITFRRLDNWLFGTFAGLAVLLTIVGLYGLVTHEVELSTRDIGVRIALGTTRSRIFGIVFARVSFMLVSGVAVGLFSDLGAQDSRPRCHECELGTRCICHRWRGGSIRRHGLAFRVYSCSSSGEDRAREKLEKRMTLRLRTLAALETQSSAASCRPRARRQASRLAAKSYR